MVIYASRSARAAATGRTADARTKKDQKDRKKFLTKGLKCGKIMPAAESERRVPCKLNNVTNTKHQKDWLFQVSFERSLMDNVN